MQPIKMPKDLDNIKSSVVAGFTLRQALSFVVAVVTIIVVWTHIRPIVSGNICIGICIAAAGPALAIGFLPKEEMQGLYAEQYFAMIVKYNVLRPVVRRYKTVNYYDTLRNEILEDEKKAKQLNQKKLTRKEMREQKKFNESIKGIR